MRRATITGLVLILLLAPLGAATTPAAAKARAPSIELVSLEVVGNGEDLRARYRFTCEAGRSLALVSTYVQQRRGRGFAFGAAFVEGQTPVITWCTGVPQTYATSVDGYPDSGAPFAPGTALAGTAMNVCTVADDSCVEVTPAVQHREITITRRHARVGGPERPFLSAGPGCCAPPSSLPDATRPSLEIFRARLAADGAGVALDYSVTCPVGTIVDVVGNTATVQRTGSRVVEGGGDSFGTGTVTCTGSAARMTVIVYARSRGAPYRPGSASTENWLTYCTPVDGICEAGEILTTTQDVTIEKR